MGTQGEPGRQVCCQPSEQAVSSKGQHSKAGRGLTVAKLEFKQRYRLFGLHHCGVSGLEGEL